jgi:hypothetical protein
MTGLAVPAIASNHQSADGYNCEAARNHKMHLAVESWAIADVIICASHLPVKVGQTVCSFHGFHMPVEEGDVADVRTMHR